MNAGALVAVGLKAGTLAAVGLNAGAVTGRLDFDAEGVNTVLLAFKLVWNGLAGASLDLLF